MCADCAATKMNALKNQSPIHSIKVGSPMQMVAVDIVGPFPESCFGNLYILIIGDTSPVGWRHFPFPIRNNHCRPCAY